MVRFDKLFKKLLSMIPTYSKQSQKIQQKMAYSMLFIIYLHNLEKVDNSLQNIIMV